MNTNQQLWAKAYAEDGFVIVPDLLDAATLERLREAMDLILNDPKGSAGGLAAQNPLRTHAGGAISGVVQGRHHARRMRIRRA